MDIARRTTAAGWGTSWRSRIFGPIAVVADAVERRSAVAVRNRATGGDAGSMVDFDLLNSGAVSLHSDRGRSCDRRRRGVRQSRPRRSMPPHPRQRRATVLFPPVEIDGPLADRWRHSANLPLDPMLAAPGRAAGTVPRDRPPAARAGAAGDTWRGRQAHAGSDLRGATRRTMERWQTVHAGEPRQISMTLARIAYDDQADEVAGKAMDFSGPTIERRWNAGYQSMLHVVERLRDNSMQPIQRGFHITKMEAK